MKVSGVDPQTGSGISITIEGTHIAAIEPVALRSSAFISPGLVDLQVNGYAGIDLNAGVPSAGRVSSLAQKLLALGVTSFCPTLITASGADLTKRLTALALAVEEDELVSLMCAGFHVEGPFISPEDGPRGAHPQEHVRAPNLDEFDAWQAASGGRINILTMSPHWPGSPDFIRAVVARGVQVAIGHTNASVSQIEAAVEAGATLSTHLGNGAAAMIPRHPNFIWAQLAEDRLTGCFIADGHHLPSETLKAMIRAKGLERSLLVSDTAALGGLPPGLYDQPIGGRVEVSEHGRLGIHGTPYLAGAWRNLNQDVALASRLADLPLSDVLRLATTNPGRFAGGRGRLAVGERADLIRFEFPDGNDNLDIKEVWLAGQRMSS